eukprot:3565284-Prymnesium_polylepis.1
MQSGDNSYPTRALSAQWAAEAYEDIPPRTIVRSFVACRILRPVDYPPEVRREYGLDELMHSGTLRALESIIDDEELKAQVHSRIYSHMYPACPSCPSCPSCHSCPALTHTPTQVWRLAAMAEEEDTKDAWTYAEDTAHHPVDDDEVTARTHAHTHCARTPHHTRARPTTRTHAPPRARTHARAPAA